MRNQRRCCGVPGQSPSWRWGALGEPQPLLCPGSLGPRLLEGDGDGALGGLAGGPWAQTLNHAVLPGLLSGHPPALTSSAALTFVFLVLHALVWHPVAQQGSRFDA